MKLISVVHHPEFGGPHNQMLRLTAPLLERGVESLVVLPEGPGAERLRSGGVPVETINLGRVRAVCDPVLQVRMAMRFPQDLTALARVFRYYKPDIVQLTSLLNPHAAIVARALGIPVTWQILDTRSPMPLRRAMMWPIRWLSDSLMPIGNAVAAAHPGAASFGDRMVVFYPPVDTGLFRPRKDARRPFRTSMGISADAPVVGTVGNINPQKGYEYFIEAASHVRQEIPDAKFVVVGHIYANHKNYYEALLTQAAESGLTPGEDIFFIGPRDDIPDVLASIDVFALASVPNSEGTPTAILEAMSCCVPVVSTDVGSVSEVVQENVTGYIVPSQDPKAMATRLSSLLRNSLLREQLGSAARLRAINEFGMDRCVDCHLRAYQIAIERRMSSTKALMEP